MKTLKFKIEGMDCADEIAILKRAITPLVEGKEEYLSFNLLNETMTISSPNDLLTTEEVISVVQGAGMRATPWREHINPGHSMTINPIHSLTTQIDNLVFKIEGMDCADEIATLKREIVPLLSSEELLVFDLINEKMTITFTPDLPAAMEIIDAVKRTGMKATLWSEHINQNHQEKTLWQNYGHTSMATLSFLCLVTGFIVDAATNSAANAFKGGQDREEAYPTESIALYSLAIATGAWFVFPKALRSAKQLRPDINLLMVTAMIGAAAINEWFEAGTVSFLFSTSLLLESWNVGRAREAIRALTDLAPATARVVEKPRLENSSAGDEIGKSSCKSKKSSCGSGCNKKQPYTKKTSDQDIKAKEAKTNVTLTLLESQEEVINEKAIEEVLVGSVIIVRPGEKIPMDAMLTSGPTEVNQAPITGESMPVRKEVGDEVFAGTINGDNTIYCKVTKAASDSTLAHIIRMVEEAQSRRAHSEQFVEQFARYYTPSMMFLAILTATVLPLALNQSWDIWIHNALVLLVIACPCALVISTPVSIIAGLNAAARQGILIKGGVYLETPAYLQAIAIDKTGTLTTGEPTVKEIVTFNGQSKENLLALALALEAHSEHPLARAIRRKGRAEGIVSGQPAEQFTLFKGKGAEGYVGGNLFWIGNRRLLIEKVGAHEPSGVREKIQALENSGHSIVAIGHDQTICGLIGIADTVRPGCKEAMQALRQTGIKNITMLTGDNNGTAKAVAQAVGLDNYQAELLPEDKVNNVELLVEQYKWVAMVGDGINDAPAMAAASLAIAMGAAGSDAAIETADIALMSDNLEKLAWLVNHSRRTLSIIKQNIIFSLAVKSLFIGLTFANKATLWMAIAADMGTSFLVVFNGLRLLNDGTRQEQNTQAIVQAQGVTERTNHHTSQSMLPFSIFKEDGTSVPLTSTSQVKGPACCYE